MPHCNGTVPLQLSDCKQLTVRRVGEKLGSGNVTRLFAAKSETINHAVILEKWLEEHLKENFGDSAIAVGETHWSKEADPAPQRCER